MAAIVADRIGDVESEVVATFLGGHAEQLAVLGLGEMFLEVGVKGGTACEVRYVAAAVEPELVDEVQRVVFHYVEIAVIAITWYTVTVFAVPFGMFYTDIFGRYHLAVEKKLLGFIFVVVFFNETEYIFHEVLVLWIVVNRYIQEFGCFNEAVDTDCEVLACDVDISGVEKREHSL